MTTQATLTIGASSEAVAVLCFIDGELDGREIVLAESTIVGRDSECDVVLPTSAKQSSSTHAIIRQVASGKRMLKDLGSKNGTFINEVRVDGGVALEPGDLIRFGDGGPTARYTVRTPEARFQPRRPTMGYGITLARAEQLDEEAGRLPTTAPVGVRLTLLDSRSEISPKSRSTTRPSGVTSTFEGLRSRCTKLAAWT